MCCRCDDRSILFATTRLSNSCHLLVRSTSQSINTDAATDATQRQIRFDEELFTDHYSMRSKRRKISTWLSLEHRTHCFFVWSTLHFYWRIRFYWHNTDVSSAVARPEQASDTENVWELITNDSWTICSYCIVSKWLAWRRATLGFESTFETHFPSSRWCRCQCSSTWTSLSLQLRLCSGWVGCNDCFAVRRLLRHMGSSNCHSELWLLAHREKYSDHHSNLESGSGRLHFHPSKAHSGEPFSHSSWFRFRRCRTLSNEILERMHVFGFSLSSALWACWVQFMFYQKWRTNLHKSEISDQLNITFPFCDEYICPTGTIIKTENIPLARQRSIGVSLRVAIDSVSLRGKKQRKLLVCIYFTKLFPPSPVIVCSWPNQSVVKRVTRITEAYDPWFFFGL